MSIVSRALIAVLAMWAAQALANTISGGIGQNIGGGIGVFDQGLSSGHAIAGLKACGSGVIDLSTGCTLGVIP